MRRVLDTVQTRDAIGAAGSAVAAASAALGVVLLLAGAALQRAFDPEVIGALTLFLWPAWLLGAVLMVGGVAAFGLGVLSAAATTGLVLVRRSTS
jgi:hypothetical protein